MAYSSVITFFYTNPSVMITHVKISPNPFVSTLSLEVIVEVNASTIVRMLDNQQKIIKMMNWTLKKGTNTTSVEDLGSLPSGLYYLDIKNMEGQKIFETQLEKLAD
jgi:hypothetical protein